VACEKQAVSCHSARAQMTNPPLASSCQDKNRIIAEYALKGVKKAIGVSEYELTRALPKKFQSSLPTVEQMEAELTRLTAPKPAAKRSKKGEPRITRMTRIKKRESVQSVVKRKGVER
jgi:hypothetical protein